MKLISQISDLKAVSGGYIQDEFVTANTIFYQSVISAVTLAVVGGILGAGAGVGLGVPVVGPILVGLLGAAGGGYLGFNYNDYSDIEPNTWVRWDVTIVYV